MVVGMMIGEEYTYKLMVIVHATPAPFDTLYLKLRAFMLNL